MASDAVVNLVVNADGADAEIRAQLIAIVNDAERRAPHIDLRVDIDNRSVVDAITALGDRIDGLHRPTRQADDDSNRLLGTLSRFGSAAGGIALNATRLTLVAGAAASALPAVGALVTSLANVAPAAAAGVTAFVGMKAITATLKVGLLGVSDALSAVFDPSADPAEVDEALKNLSVNARAFVQEIQKAKPALDDLRLDVQDKLFAGLDKSVSQLAKATLPTVRRASLDYAGTLNDMAQGAVSAGVEMGNNGTLGKALAGSQTAFRKLERIPAQVLTAIGQLAAGGGGLLNKLADKIADVADSASKKLNDAFESGALDKAISTAVTVLKELGTVAGNVFTVVSNIFSAADASGGGLFTTLEKVTGALADVTAGKEFQGVLSSLIDVGQTLADTVLPLLELAFTTLAPVIQALAPIVQEIVTDLGDQLAQIIPALQPLLLQLVDAFGKLWEALSPLLPVFTQLLIEIMPSLVDILISLTDILVALTPAIVAMAEGASTYLVPALVGVTEIIATLIDWFAQMVEFTVKVGDALISFTSNVIFNTLVAGLAVLLDFLDGDFSSGWLRLQKLIASWGDSVSTTVSNVWTIIYSLFITGLARITGTTVSGLQNLIYQFASKTNSMVQSVINGFARIVSGINQQLAYGVSAVVRFFSSVVGAFASAPSLLYKAGQSLISGFISGMKSQIGAVGKAASSILSAARDYFPFSPAKKGPFSGKGYTLYSGQKLITDFARGIESRHDWVTRALQNMGRPLLSSTGLVTPTTGYAEGGGAIAGLVGATFTRSAPSVFVYLGNELVNDHVQVIVDGALTDFNRTASQGVRA